MSGKRIRWTLRALPGLMKSALILSPDAAARVIARIVTVVDVLAELPASGRPGRIKGSREVVLADIPYIIAYRVSRDNEINAVMYAHQRWPSAAHLVFSQAGRDPSEQQSPARRGSTPGF